LPAIAQAQDGSPAFAANDSGIVEIVVTAQKREENLQDVPVAITAVTDAILRANNVTSFVGLSNLTPGLTISPAEGGDRVTMSIRGVGQEANQNDVAAPSVSYHQDGVYVVSPFALGAAFLDVGTLEVVRGPQGTLFGQNSTGGATNINSVKPKLGEFAGYAQGAIGSYEYRSLAAAVSVPIGSRFAVRLSGEGIWQDGSTLNIVNGQDLDDKDQIAWRAIAVWQPFDNLTISGTAQQFRSDVNGAARFGLYDLTPGKRLLAQDDPSSLKLDTEFYSLVVALDLPAFTIKYLGSRQLAEINRSRDNDFTNVYSSFTGVSIVTPFALRRSFEERQDQLHKSWTSELNIVSSERLFGAVDWVLGGFWFDQKIEAHTFERVDQNRNGVLNPFTLAPNPVVFGIPPFGADVGFQSDFFPSRESYSFYGQATWHATEALRLTGGLRYTHDTAHNINYNFFTIQLDRPTADITKTGKAVTGQARIEFDIADDVMTYASFTKGFKPGGNNLTFGRVDVADDLVFASFKPETIYAYEAGLKGDFLDRTLRLNLAGFYYDYSNLQAQGTDPRNTASGVVNIPKSSVYGMEAEFQWVPVDRLKFTGNATFLKSKISESFIALDGVKAAAAELPLILAGAGNFADSVTLARNALREDLNGNKLAKTPPFAANLTTQYSTPLEADVVANASITVSYRDKMQARIFNNPAVDKIPAHTLVNAQFGFAYRETLEVSLTIQNVFDKDVIASRFTDAFGVYSTFDQKIPPRTFILSTRYKF
jgi:iron complex outermembrane receptor protein